METINEAVNESAIKSINKSLDKNGLLSSTYMGGFKNGVEFAQRWISVEESPEDGMEIIAKNDIYYEAFTYFADGYKDIEYIRLYFSHWRPIEII